MIDRMYRDKNMSHILSIGIVCCLFIYATYLAQTHINWLVPHLNHGAIQGQLIYVTALILATVIAPLSTMPLIPIATTVWGSLHTALLSIIGWGIGSMIAFYISRRYGYPLASRVVSPTLIQRIRTSLTHTKRVFLTLLILRMMTPVDILSYALGLVPDLSWRMYILTTWLGIIPFAYVFAYLGGLSPTTQLIGCAVLIPLLITVWHQTFVRTNISHISD